MKGRINGLYLALLVFTFALAAPAFAAPAREPLTFDWIFSEEGKTAAGLPSYAWLEDGRVLLYDRYPPLSERTIESFDASPVIGTGRVWATSAISEPSATTDSTSRCSASLTTVSE